MEGLAKLFGIQYSSFYITTTKKKNSCIFSTEVEDQAGGDGFEVLDVYHCALSAFFLCNLASAVQGSASKPVSFQFRRRKRHKVGESNHSMVKSRRSSAPSSTAPWLTAQVGSVFRGRV
jgi:hypothetical protein